MTDIETLPYPFSPTSEWYAVAWLALATKNSGVKLDLLASRGKFGEVRKFVVPPVPVPIKCVRREAVEAFFGPLVQHQIEWANATWRPFVRHHPHTDDATASEDTRASQNNKEGRPPDERTR